jgi:hypothetical protein
LKVRFKKKKKKHPLCCHTDPKAVIEKIITHSKNPWVDTLEHQPGKRFSLAQSLPALHSAQLSESRKPTSNALDTFLLALRLAMFLKRSHFKYGKWNLCPLQI